MNLENKTKRLEVNGLTLLIKENEVKLLRLALVMSEQK